MTAEERRIFGERGYVLLERAVPHSRLRPLRDHIVGELKRHGVNASGRGLPQSIRQLPVFQQITTLTQLVNIPDLATQALSARAMETVESLAQTKVTTSQSQLLLSPPNQGEWSLDALSWHTDLSAFNNRVPGIQAFVLIEDLAPQGGATLILAGSHLFAGNPQTSARLRAALRSSKDREPMLRDLNLSIVELSGKAGDVYLMDMRVLHTPSVNASKCFRMVATVRYFLT